MWTNIITSFVGKGWATVAIGIYPAYLPFYWTALERFRNWWSNTPDYKNRQYPLRSCKQLQQTKAMTQGMLHGAHCWHSENTFLWSRKTDRGRPHRPSADVNLDQRHWTFAAGTAHSSQGIHLCAQGIITLCRSTGPIDPCFRPITMGTIKPCMKSHYPLQAGGRTFRQAGQNGEIKTASAATWTFHIPVLCGNLSCKLHWCR